MRPYTCGMNWAKTLTDIAATPVRVGLAAADAGLEVAVAALDLAKRGFGDATVPSPKDSVVHILGLDDTVERANRLAQLIEADAPLGRALSPDGAVDRLMRSGGLIDRLTAPDGVLERLTAAAHMEAQIHTGRTHQIRVHFQFLGHPVVGDTTYGAKPNQRLTEQTGYAAPRVLLHAHELSFVHPRTEKPVDFKAPLPPDFRKALKFLRK